MKSKDAKVGMLVRTISDNCYNALHSIGNYVKKGDILSIEGICNGVFTFKSKGIANAFNYTGVEPFDGLNWFVNTKCLPVKHALLKLAHAAGITWGSGTKIGTESGSLGCDSSAYLFQDNTGFWNSSGEYLIGLGLSELTLEQAVQHLLSKQPQKRQVEVIFYSGIIEVEGKRYVLKED